MATMFASGAPNVLSEMLLRDSAVISTPADDDDDARSRLDLSQVSEVAASFRNIAHIAHLDGLKNLTRLRLDNNIISEIEGLEQLSNLTALDLSFNNITQIKGLDHLSLLTDLSLFHNRIERIENLEALTQLQVLSIGANRIAQMDTILQLRSLPALRLLTLADNPICADPEYKLFVLAHVKGLQYFDNARVDAESMAKAREQYQDEVLHNEEAAAAAEAKRAAEEEKAAAKARLAAANLSGLNDLFQRIVDDDPELKRLRMIPGLTEDALGDFREKFRCAVEEFKQQSQTTTLESHRTKSSEAQKWHSAVAKLTTEQDAASRFLIQTVQEDVTHLPVGEESKAALEAKVDELREELMSIESYTVEAAEELTARFTRRYAELVEESKGAFAAFFGQARELESSYFEGISTAAMNILEQFQAGGPEMTAELPEEAQLLLQDKDALVNALQASHDSHTSKIDALEDTLVGNEGRRFEDMLMQSKLDLIERNRQRIMEITCLVERTNREIEQG